MWSGLTIKPISRDGWLACFALLPVIALYAAYFWFVPPGDISTGFIEYDQLYYLANARAEMADGFHLFYGLPFSPDDTTPRIYFQPQTLVCALLLRYAGLTPTSTYCLFGFVAGLIYFRVAIALYREVVRSTGLAASLTLLMFLWAAARWSHSAC